MKGFKIQPGLGNTPILLQGLIINNKENRIFATGHVVKQVFRRLMIRILWFAKIPL